MTLAPKSHISHSQSAINEPWNHGIRSVCNSHTTYEAYCTQNQRIRFKPNQSETLRNLFFVSSPSFSNLASPSLTCCRSFSTGRSASIAWMRAISTFLERFSFHRFASRLSIGNSELPSEINSG